jgi:hypothetical protein
MWIEKGDSRGLVAMPDVEDGLQREGHEMVA